MSKRDLKDLPKWLQELWELRPSLARKAESNMFTDDELIFVESVLNEKLEFIRNMDRVEPWTKGTGIYEMRINLETALEKVRKM